MSTDSALEKNYNPREVEPAIYKSWEDDEAFKAIPDGRSHAETFTIVIPPPNVTGALHLGHALNNTLQDILVRYHRMRGFNTLWQPGTDHAGIATQAVVERRIREEEGKTRHELGREELVRRIWQWKDAYEKRILNQLKMMGCSCDWSRARFTLDDGMSQAVRRMFFKLFKDGLIFRGKRLVNWDTQLQTAVSDDEVYYETTKGHFWHFKYPVIEGEKGEPEFVVIATTRPETMLGDTAVAVHPDPERFFNEQEIRLTEGLEDLSSRTSGAARRDAIVVKAKLEALRVRRESHLPQLIQLRDMARDGRELMLPLVERVIPLITDEWANPLLGSGCVKITPAHDPNDYEVGLRHSLPMINVMTPEGKIARIVEPGGSVNPHSANYEGLGFTSDCRDKVVADLDALGLVAEIEDRDIEISYSDRSKLPIEPYLSDQWFIKTGDGGTEGLRDEGEGQSSTLPNVPTTKSSGLAQAAMDAVTDGRIQVFPPRYGKSYLDWLGEKRDWCISRQLWWGHRIPLWTIRCPTPRVQNYTHIQPARAEKLCELAKACEYYLEEAGEANNFRIVRSDCRRNVIQLCTFTDTADHALVAFAEFHSSFAPRIREPGQVPPLVLNAPTGFVQTKDSARAFNRLVLAGPTAVIRDEDVLDTWFSSALWPFSTLGWPEKTPHLKQHYPGSVLCTSRDIITNWVARMVMFGLYAMGEVPFDHVFIHPKILDGRGETMSKSKGNGVDPVDVIHTHGADALRYSMADMTTETQDIRMPVEYVCPHCGGLTDQTLAIKAETQRRKSRGEKLDRKLQPADCTRIQCVHKECGKEFATQWADETVKKELPLGRETSDKFDIGRNFCNKLWNAARFALMNLDDTPCDRLDIAALPPEDRWILARLSQTIRRYHECIQRYQFSASVRELRDFFWDSLCDWYIELTKPRLSGNGVAAGGDTDPCQQVLAFCIDQVLRLWHPTIPFITEHLWGQLNTVAPSRGLPGVADLRTDTKLITAEFPPVQGYAALDSADILQVFAGLQDVVRGVRDLRVKCNVPPNQAVKATVVLPPSECDAFEAHGHIVLRMAHVSELTVDPTATRPVNAGSLTIGSMRLFVHDISDDKAERKRATKQLETLSKQIAGKESKLSNEKFVANARPDVVGAERERLNDMIAQRTALEKHLADLAG